MDASLLVLISNQKILLQKKCQQAPHHPGKWTLFGGGINPYESASACIHREIKEELQISLSTPELFHQINIADGNKYFFWQAYDQKQPLMLTEGESMQWFLYSDLHRLAMPDHHRAAINVLRTKQILLHC